MHRRRVTRLKPFASDSDYDARPVSYYQAQRPIDGQPLGTASEIRVSEPPIVNCRTTARVARCRAGVLSTLPCRRRYRHARQAPIRLVSRSEGENLDPRRAGRFGDRSPIHAQG